MCNPTAPLPVGCVRGKEASVCASKREDTALPLRLYSGAATVQQSHCAGYSTPFTHSKFEIDHKKMYTIIKKEITALPLVISAQMATELCVADLGTIFVHQLRGEMLLAARRAESIHAQPGPD